MIKRKAFVSRNSVPQLMVLTELRRQITRIEESSEKAPMSSPILGSLPHLKIKFETTTKMNKYRTLTSIKISTR